MEKLEKKPRGRAPKCIHCGKIEDEHFMFERYCSPLWRAALANGHAGVLARFERRPSRAKQIKSLMEDSGYNRTEATQLVDAGF